MASSFYIHTFGCQMNLADSEIVTAILTDGGFVRAGDEASADVVLLNSCAVRENAEERLGNILTQLKGRKRRQRELVVGVLGCVPQFERERVFSDFPFVDFIVGPDNYRELAGIIENSREQKRLASLDYDQQETYAGIDPVRTGSISAFLPVMRGCNNYCAFCVVPVTRGRERSVGYERVLAEVAALAASGFREVTLLGQNVNSWRDAEKSLDFAGLLDGVSQAAPSMRIRFTTSHPKDISEALVKVIAARPNLCNHIHLPVQSGSSRMLDLMKRGHTREEYLDRIAMIRRHIPDAAITTDLIAGFCTETEEEHRETLSLMEAVGYDTAFMFHYSVRPGTWAARNLPDDVPEALKKRRLQEIIELQNAMSREIYRREIGKTVEVLAEAESRRSSLQLMGRTKTNRAVVFSRGEFNAGDTLLVKITGATSATLTGEAVS
ncbi:tRNA (N6-isopentenyl adenosine(37)-C2)-methylthiotransferase MiaB [Chlorobaculum thiosulfatiphilum]|uniref:tRNA-2-methylthio-N(6)-dimethylallyladenosine synthase n=1 Tax=Chlorobaculum thiosulfatiphilum TaxID=115852 RepID=A0A5C4S9U9_CHLTI|nr:tRNA (N6-isopentenyl adenosine(37)-C2)-methylthiotransferase MiaB [Chlorobaculum thiosulfatiphilum]TNJ40032.1 tRNA (N6-isopentenyl adenosine(37)-C2)-methylthiotransferase MiaB [Chlorobaculum thiosulfatiphilum]